MLLLAVLALLGLGAVLGAAGMRRLGRWTGRATAQWRPGVGVGSILLAFAALAVLVRGAWIVGLVLLLLALGLAVGSRRRPRRSPRTGQVEMSEAEARSILGVGSEAGAAEIKTAYLRLMQRVHPDHGGASGLAAQLNAARKRLLG
jgi:hypothetical protein